MRIDIGIPTFRRSQMLREALLSVASQHVPSSWALRILVVDNDTQSSSRCTAYAASSARIPVVYSHEPTPGVAAARNRLLELADADFLAFLDDDEIAASDWLVQIVDTARRYSADVVFGPVLSQLPRQTPRWIHAGRFFQRPRFRTGTQRDGGASGNALLRMSAIHRLRVRFDTRFKTAGEDTGFFAKLAQRRAHMVWCDEALVFETVTADRLTVGWQLRRALRSGHAFAELFAPERRTIRRVRWTLYRSALIVVSGLCVLPAYVLGMHRGVMMLKKLAANLGQLRGAQARDAAEA